MSYGTDKPVTTNINQDSGVKAVAEIVRQHLGHTVLKLQDAAGVEREVLLVSDQLGALRTQSVKSLLAEYRTEPERRQGAVVVHDQRSLVAIIDRFKDPHSALFADVANRDNPSLRAIFDYHEPTGGRPRFGKHQASYTFPIADEWKAWLSVDGKALGQLAFAEWIEEHGLDLIDPDFVGDGPRALLESLGVVAAKPGRIQEIARGLSVRVDEQVRNAVTLSSGECQISYATQHTDAAGAPIVVPALFVIAIPVFKNGAAYTIPVRLRYRAAGGKITWTMLLVQPDKAFDRAIREVCDEVADDVELPIYYGTPEGTCVAVAT